MTSPSSNEWKGRERDELYYRLRRYADAQRVYSFNVGEFYVVTGSFGTPDNHAVITVFSPEPKIIILFHGTEEHIRVVDPTVIEKLLPVLRNLQVLEDMSRL